MLLSNCHVKFIFPLAVAVEGSALGFSLCLLFHVLFHVSYPNNAICNTCPNGVMFTNHIFEWQIQRIFDYFRFLLTLSRRRPISYRNQSIDFLCKSMEIKTLKVGFSNVHSISWLYEIINCFVFTSSSKQELLNSVQSMHGKLNKWTGVRSFRSILGTSALCVQVQSKSLWN